MIAVQAFAHTLITLTVLVALTVFRALPGKAIMGHGSPRLPRVPETLRIL